MVHVMQERKRAAQLLSQLPADIDIAMLLQPETNIAAVPPAKARKGKKSIVPAVSSGFKSAKLD